MRYRPSSFGRKGKKMRIASHVAFKTTTLISGAGHVDLLPHATGRDAFWLGRPIWANPLTGEPARNWAAGWRAGLEELRKQCGQGELPTPDGSAAWQALIRAHRQTERSGRSVAGANTRAAGR